MDLPKLCGISSELEIILLPTPNFQGQSFLSVFFLQQLMNQSLNLTDTGAFIQSLHTW